MGGEFRTRTIGRGGTFNRGRGQVTFSTLENFMSGTTTSNGQIFIGDPRRHVSGKAMSAFFQDDWRIMPKLILNLGLRYEYTTPITEANDQFANFDPARGLLQLGKNTDRCGMPTKTTLRRGSVSPTTLRVTAGRWFAEAQTSFMLRRAGGSFLSQQNQNNPSVGSEHQPQRLPALQRRREHDGARAAPTV